MEFGTDGFGLQYLDIFGMRFFAGSAGPQEIYESSYSPVLVLISYGFAFFGSYVGLVISQQIAAAKQKWTRAGWTAAGAIAMGGGVWSMHFIGMLAFSLPFSVQYDLSLTIISLTPSIFASAIVLLIISRRKLRLSSLLIGGLLTGAGIGAMHFIGMAAMRANTSMGYDPTLFALSIFVAVGLACVALSAKFRIEALNSSLAAKWSNAIGGVIMGLAISGMHYMAMEAVTFYPGDFCAVPGYTVGGDLLTVLVNVFSFMVIALVLAASIARKLLTDSSLLSSIFQYSVEGIVIIDGRGRITLFSPAAERIFGYQAREILGRNVSHLMPHKVAANHDGFLSTNDGVITSNALGRNREITAVGKAGNKIPIEIGVSDISIGREVMFAATIRDITERKEAERAMRRAHDELEQSLKQQIELNETQAEFVSMVSHEFRTPLAIIDMTAQRLMRSKQSPTTEALVERAEKIRSAVKRMGGLMESMLSTATLTAGELNIQLANCDIRDLVERACNRQREISKKHNIQFDLDGLPPEIIADGPAVDQILTNLLSNAVKYSPDAPDIHVCGWQESENVYISVKDSGLGIDEDDLPKMFDKYFRAKTALSIGGTGIGLSLSRHLAERHGGTVTLESKRDVGSTFTLCLPVRPTGNTSGQSESAA